ncbi:hypothetical protein E5226_16310, partial [Cellulomonas shaoxiangyii]
MASAPTPAVPAPVAPLLPTQAGPVVSAPTPLVPHPTADPVPQPQQLPAPGRDADPARVGGLHHVPQQRPA